LILAVIACGVLISSTLDKDSAVGNEPAGGAVPLRPPVLTFIFGRERLLLRGTTVSDTHEGALLQLAADHFDGFDTQTDFSAGIVLDSDWESASIQSLFTLAAMRSGEAVIRDHSISIRGVTSNVEAYAARLERLREILADNFVVDADVLTIGQASAAGESCERVFSQLTIEPIAFRKSSAAIRSASLVTLDRITEFAHDCQHTVITITGHTDATGDESWNRQLSFIRAQAVATHLIGRGVDPARLTVSGRGSSEPVADNSTVRGRELNRRIEFALQ
jgi:OOP family OmpA-OmpF porin